jgi:DDE superfamily endonuclease
MGAVFDLADRADAQLFQGLVIQLAAVVLAHARTRPDPDHKVNLLVNGLVTAARRFFERATATTKVAPVEVITDRAGTYPVVLAELFPAAWHQTEQYANNRVECDHGRLKARLRPMRGSSGTTAPE